jgi:iron complex transport system substrate-binding protein
MTRYLQKGNGVLQICLLLVCLMTAGCGLRGAEEGGPETAFFDGVDDQGSRVVLKKRPERIVSLSVGLDEIIMALAAPEHIQALSWYTQDKEMSPLAAEAAQYPHIHGQDPESVVAYQPDLVLIYGSENTPTEYVQALRSLGLTVFVSDSPHALAAVFPRIEKIGRLLGAAEQADALTVDMRARLAKIENKVRDIPPEKRAVVMAFGNSGQVFGRQNDLFDDMCTHAGLRNGAAMAGLTVSSPISKEQIIAVDPDVFLLPTWGKPGQEAAAASQQIITDPAFRGVKAVQNQRFVYVSDAYRYSTSQYAVIAVEKLAQAVYPERF